MLSKEELTDLLLSDIQQFNEEVKNNPNGLDLSETDLSGTNLNGAEFVNVDLTSSSFASTACFICCNESNISSPDFLV